MNFSKFLLIRSKFRSSESELNSFETIFDLIKIFEHFWNPNQIPDRNIVWKFEPIEIFLIFYFFIIFEIRTGFSDRIPDHVPDQRNPDQKYGPRTGPSKIPDQNPDQVPDLIKSRTKNPDQFGPMVRPSMMNHNWLLEFQPIMISPVSPLVAPESLS